MLGSSEADLHAAKQRVDVLTEHLQGADVAFMVQEDPFLMFEDLEPSKRVYIEGQRGAACGVLGSLVCFQGPRRQHTSSHQGLGSWTARLCSKPPPAVLTDNVSALH